MGLIRAARDWQILDRPELKRRGQITAVGLGLSTIDGEAHAPIAPVSGQPNRVGVFVEHADAVVRLGGLVVPRSLWATRV